MARKDPVVAVTDPDSIIVGRDLIGVVGPRFGQIVHQFVGQAAEIKIIFLGWDRQSGIKRAMAAFLYFAEVEGCGLGIALVVEKIVWVERPLGVVDAVEGYVGAGVFAVFSYAFYCCADVIADIVPFDSEQTAVEPEVEPAAWTLGSGY